MTWPSGALVNWSDTGVRSFFWISISRSERARGRPPAYFIRRLLKSLHSFPFMENWNGLLSSNGSPAISTFPNALTKPSSFAAWMALASR